VIPSPAKNAFRKHGPWVGAGVGICAAFLMVREGYAPVAKHEAIDPAGVITWCYGRTNFDDPSVKAGARFDRDQCKVFLEQDLPKYAAPVQECVPAFDAMPPQRQAALVSFAYNLGSATLCRSSVAREMNAGRVHQACDAMLLYNRVNGRVCDDVHCGLGARRRAERVMCLAEDVPAK
jgi:lysozyme